MTIQREFHRALHPELRRYAEERARNAQNRIADGITSFAGSMWFVYIHIVIFAWWLPFKGQPFFDDPFPFGLLTMVVSLEAIFLSTFVMISQNRADDRRQLIASHQWELTQTEWQENAEILRLSREVLELTKEVHSLTQAVHAAVLAQPED